MLDCYDDKFDDIVTMFLWEVLVWAIVVMPVLDIPLSLRGPFWARWYEIVTIPFLDMAARLSIHNTIELHLSGLGGTASHPDNWSFLW